MLSQKPGRPHFEVLGVAAGQRHQPALSLRRDRALLAGPGAVVEGSYRTIGQSSPDIALNRLMMGPKACAAA
jgi:hypothetical protein